MRNAIIILILAIGCCLQAVAQGQMSYNMKRANESFEMGNYRDAMNYTEAELGNNPQSCEALMLQCRIFLKHDFNDAALITINKALKYAPKKANALRAEMLNYRSQAYAAIGDTAKTLTDIQTAIMLDTTVPDHLYAHINLMRDLEDLAAEAPDIQLLESRFPDNAVANIYVGRYYTDVANYEEALKHLNYAVKLQPNLSSPLSYRAKCYIKQHKWNDAARDVTAALDLNINSFNKQLLEEMVDSAFIPMMANLKTKSKADADNATWPYLLGSSYEDAEKFDEAIGFYKEAIKRGGEGSDVAQMALENMAHCYCSMGNFPQAFSSITEALKCDSTYGSFLASANIIYESCGLYDEAVGYANRLIEADPESYNGYGCLGTTLYLAERYEEALEAFNTSYALYPYDNLYLNYRGRTLRHLGREDEARADFERVIAINDEVNGEEFICRNEVIAYALLGRTAEAEEAYRKYTEKYAKISTQFSQARMLTLLGKTDEALSMLEDNLPRNLNYAFRIQHDPDFDSLRGTERYASLIDSCMNAMTLPGAVDEAADSALAADTILTTEELITTEVPFTKEAGIYKVKCTINGLPLDFYFDTGAADVTISDVEALFMLKNGYLTKSDIRGKAYYGDANGDLNEGTIINLRKVEFGGLTLENVKASIVHNQQAPLLLGQTVLSRLGKIEIDYSQSQLKITHTK